MREPDEFSPCVGICRMDESGEYCIGCNRTLDEIAAWSRLSPAWRKHLMAEIRLRSPAGRAGPGTDGKSNETRR